LRFWRCHPNLVFNQESLAASRQPQLRTEDRGKYVFSKAQQVLENHSGIGVKTKIPRVLQKLSIVWVRMCGILRTIEIDAPKLSTFSYEGWRRPLSRFTLGDSLETKKLDMHTTSMRDMIQYAGSNLPSIAPNLETLVLSTVDEVPPKVYMHDVCICMIESYSLRPKL
ncbi:hypothetical protein BAE44_0014852, partial [Dichanthelium oligosanthes]